MKGDIAASNGFGHSSCGRWPHPDIATSLCIPSKSHKGLDKSIKKLFVCKCLTLPLRLNIKTKII